MSNSYVNKIQVGTDTHLIQPTLYGTSDTTAATGTKNVTLPSFKLITGAQVAIKFSNTNTAAVANLKLKFNSESDDNAKPIKYRGANLPAVGTLAAGRVYNFVYDGANWELVGDLDTNTWNALSTSQAGYVSQAPNDTTKFLCGDASWTQVDWGDLTGKPSSFTPSFHTHSNLVTIGDQRNTATIPNDYNNKLTFAGLKGTTTIGNPSTNTYSYVVGLRGWSDYTGGDAHELAFNNNGINWRHGATTEWGNWYLLAHSGNVSTGDSSGQIKIAGVNVTVKDIGGAAYKAANYYALASHGTHVTTETVKSALGATADPTAKKFLKDTGDWVQVAWGDLSGIPSSFTPSSHTHDFLNTKGNIAAESGGTKPTQKGLSMRNAYGSNQGYPYTYGNVLTMYGAGATQLFMGWNSSSNSSTGVHADAYIRSQRDTDGSLWSDWSKLLDTANYKTYTVSSIAGLQGDVTLAQLGLSSALRYQGTTTTAMEDGRTTAAVTIGGNSFTPTQGDVVIYNDAEYVWTGSLWELLGAESSFKKVQTAVNSSSASGNSVTTFVSSVTQDTQGVITVKTSTLDTSGTWSGTANFLNYHTQLSTKEAVDGFHSNAIGIKAAKVSSIAMNDTDTWNSNDGIIIDIPWSNLYGHQVYIDDNSYQIHHRYGTSKTVDGVNVIDWKPWVKAIYTDSRSSVGSSTQPIYIDANGKVVACATYENASVSNATTATKSGIATIWLYPENNDEINFGGTNTSTTIFVGYRAKDSRAIPTKFIFGGATGTADLQAKTVYLGSGTTSYISSTQYTGNAATSTVMGNGKHTAAVTANEFSSILTTPGTMTLVGNVSNTLMPHSNNANAELIIKTHPTSGTSYYEARLGFSSDGALYYMPVNTATWKQVAYTDSSITGNATTATTATNLSAKPVLAASGNNITVTAGGKTSDAFTVPYATNSTTATKLSYTTITTMSAITSLGDTKVYAAGSMTDTIDGMSTGTLLNVGGGNGYYRVWQIWNQRGDNLRWRTPLSDASGWGAIRTILDTSNTTAPSSVPTLSWNTESTIFTLNGAAVKIKAMAKPSYAFTDLTSHPTTLSGYGITDAAPAVTGGYLPFSGGTMSGTITLANTGLKTPQAAGYTTDQYGNFKHQQATASDSWQLLSNAGVTNFKYVWETGNISTSGSISATGGFAGNLSGNATSATTATTATNVAWSGITNKPIDFGTYSGALNTNGWKTLGGRSSGSKIYISYNNNAAAWNSETYSASMVFGCNDTKGLIDCGYNTPKVTFGGGSVNGTTDNDPKWYFRLSATSGQIYTFPATSKTLAASDGSNASGTWGISITGTATTADKLTGFSSRASTMTWGNQTGSVITCFASPAGGGWGFRDNNPASGQLSMTIDGTIYIKEGAVNIGDAIKSITRSGNTFTYTTLWGGTGTFTQTDEKVTHTLGTTTKYYVTGTTSATTSTSGDTFDTGVYVTTVAGELSAVRHSWNISGAEKAYTTYNSTDDSIDFIFV